VAASQSSKVSGEGFFLSLFLFWKCIEASSGPENLRTVMDSLLAVVSLFPRFFLISSHGGIVLSFADEAFSLWLTHSSPLPGDPFSLPLYFAMWNQSQCKRWTANIDSAASKFSCFT
jgi:hypothetical protein